MFLSSQQKQRPEVLKELRSFIQRLNPKRKRRQLTNEVLSRNR